MVDGVEIVFRAGFPLPENVEEGGLGADVADSLDGEVLEHVDSGLVQREFEEFLPEVVQDVHRGEGGDLGDRVIDESLVGLMTVLCQQENVLDLVCPEGFLLGEELEQGD